MPSVDTSLQKFLSVKVRVAEDPASYHIGMTYLTGKPGPADSTVCWSEEDMLAISSYVHLVRDKSTLGKAKVWIDRQLCAGSVAYIKIGQVRQLVSAPMNEEEYRCLMEAFLAGSSGGGLAVQADIMPIEVEVSN